MYLRPDPSTFSIIEPAGVPCARLICEVVTPSGEPYRGDGRGTLRALLDQRRVGRAGLPGGTRDRVLPLPGRRDRAAGGRSEQLLRAQPWPLPAGRAGDRVGLEAIGIHVESSHHEVASGQFELDLPLLPALVAADTVTTLKPAVKELARERGMQATFMPKPLADAAGSGMHVHQVLVDRTGRSVFDDPSRFVRAVEPSPRRSWPASSIMPRGCRALVAPTVNSYKRLVPGYEAPVAGSWGRHSRGALIRVPTPVRGDASPGEVFGTRLELRLVDPSCNPYLAFTAMLAAGLDGLDRGCELGPPLEELEHGFGGGGHSVTKPLPASLGEALAALEDDDVITDALGSELMELFRSRQDARMGGLPAPGHAVGARYVLPALLNAALLNAALLSPGRPAQPLLTMATVPLIWPRPLHSRSALL